MRRGPASCRRVSVRGLQSAVPVWRRANHSAAALVLGTTKTTATGGTVHGCAGGCLLYQSSNCIWLACTERDDAPDGIVRRDTDGNAISRNDLYAEATHAPTQLSEHLVAGVALYAVKTAAVNCHHGALHVNQIVLAQSG